MLGRASGLIWCAHPCITTTPKRRWRASQRRSPPSPNPGDVIIAVAKSKNRSWAIRYLADLFAHNPANGRILTHLAALCLPEILLGVFHRIATRAVRPSRPVDIER